MQCMDISCPQSGAELRSCHPFNSSLTWCIYNKKHTSSTCGCKTELPLGEFASGQMWFKSPFHLTEQMSSRSPTSIDKESREAEMGPMLFTFSPSLCYS